MELPPGTDTLHLFQLAAGDNILAPVQRAPTFERESSFIALETWIGELKQKRSADDSEENGNPPEMSTLRIKHSGIGGFAVSGQTFYAEWKHRLFKWKFGDSEWMDTGFVDPDSTPENDIDNRFELAASAETVYVGKRDGKLFQSLDEGDSWKDVTPILPLRFTGFKEIMFVGTTVYVATDEGVLTSRNGEHWRVLTDEMGARPIIDRFAVCHTTFTVPVMRGFIV